MSGISGNTKVFFILGDPVAQVRAPEVYNPLFRDHGIDAVLVPLKLPAAALPGFLQHGMRAENIGGLWATIPHKGQLAALLNPVDPVAQIEALSALEDACQTERGFEMTFARYLITARKPA